jgi:ethanolamine utilization protein EutP (predicted NTPase)
LDRQIGVRIRRHIPKRPGDAMGPVRRSEATHSETIYLVSRTEQARDRRIAAVRRWIVDAVAEAK